MNPVDAVRHDASALCHFIDQISERCILAESPSYTSASAEFFRYISDLAQATKDYLKSYTDNLDFTLAQTDPEAFYTEAQQIQTLRYSWFRLHSYVKPALDADTLEVPHTLVKVLTQSLQNLPDFQAARFAVLHTSDLNYYQVKTGYIQLLAADLSTSIPGAPPFPKDLGLLFIPYSQSSALFLNLALAHEMGHFAFDKRDERKQLTPAVVSELISHPDLALLTTNGPLTIRLSVDRVLGWLTEIYCDLFAVRLVGPCFSFGYIELFALSRNSRSELNGLGKSAIYSLVDFSDSHPAEALRIREQVAFMKKTSLGWWPEIETSTSSHVQLLKDAADVPNDAFNLEPSADSQLNKIALDIFFKVLPRVQGAVEAAFFGISSGVVSFQTHKTSIYKYLGLGVVPSRLVDAGSVSIPTAMSLLNSAQLFYLDEFDSLISRIESADFSCIECRSMWLQKLEMWATKALEDVSS